MLLTNNSDNVKYDSNKVDHGKIVLNPKKRKHFTVGVDAFQGRADPFEGQTPGIRFENTPETCQTFFDA